MPSFAGAIESWGWLLAYLEDGYGYEVELVASGQ